MSAILQGKGDVFGPIGAVAGNVPLFDGTTGKILKDGGWSPNVFAAMPRSHLKGLQTANNATDAANDIDIGEGECRDSTNSVDIKLPALITKRIDAAWAPGNNAGGLDTGTVANTSYHVFVILRADTGAVDALLSASAAAPVLPANYAYFRRVGSIRRLAAANVAFGQTGDRFYTNQIIDYNSTAARSKSLLVLSVPLGIIVRPMCVYDVIVLAGTDSYMEVSNASGAIQSSGAIPCRGRIAAGDIGNGYCDMVLTNTSGQIYLTVTIASGTSVTEGMIRTYGWIDRRGQDD